MDRTSINNEIEYREALEELEPIFVAKKGTLEGKKLEQLVQLIEEYEKKFHPLE